MDIIYLLWCGLPALIIFGCWSLFEPTIIKILLLIIFLKYRVKDLFYEQTLSFFNGNFSGEITNEIKAASSKYASIKILLKIQKFNYSCCIIGSLTLPTKRLKIIIKLEMMLK